MGRWWAVGGWLSNPKNKAKPSPAGAWSLTRFSQHHKRQRKEFVRNQKKKIKDKVKLLKCHNQVSCLLN